MFATFDTGIFSRSFFLSVYNQLNWHLIYDFLCSAGESESLSGELSKEKLLNSKVIPEGTFLVLATQLNQGDVVRNLLSSGADPNICSAFLSVKSDVIKQIYIDELLRATANSE